MLFNSLEFALFLPVVYSLYLVAPYRGQNLLLLAASYVFYGFWDPRFLILIGFSTVVDYSAGVLLDRFGDKSGHDARTRRRRKWVLAISVIANLGVLGFFKYYNFFSQSLADLLTQVGLQPHMSTLNILLPVGISFYTFQTLSYTIDVYKGKIPATRDFLSFATFVAFFPQLVAGPIERAKDFLPQFQRRRTLVADDLADGGRLMLWGFFKKVVIADNLAAIVDQGYGPEASGSLVLLATYAFAFQIYCDFSGYSDIARGCAKLFGFHLQGNFFRPYLATSIPAFWQRWHVSLSSWFREYFYIPLGGNQVSRPRHLVNVMATFVVSGLWHGANWRFVVWGAIHGLGYLPTSIYGKRVTPRPVALQFVFWVLTFHFVLLAWVFFRAESVSHALNLIEAMMTWSPGELMVTSEALWRVVGLSGSVLFFELLQRKREHPLSLGHLFYPLRLAATALFFLLILVFGNFDNVPFIYFQF